jgi:hypothetical protein
MRKILMAGAAAAAMLSPAFAEQRSIELQPGFTGEHAGPVPHAATG